MNRKGWTHQSGNSAAANGTCVNSLDIHTANIFFLIGRFYDIYDQKLTPAIDMRSHVHRWLHFLEEILLRRPLTEDEFIFPTIGRNGMIYTSKAIDHTAFQTQLNHFTRCAGIDVEYTTHSFRRGGAQYRFQYSTLTERWSLSCIRWWGGWAEGEQACYL